MIRTEFRGKDFAEIGKLSLKTFNVKTDDAATRERQYYRAGG